MEELPCGDHRRGGCSKANFVNRDETSIVNSEASIRPVGGATESWTQNQTSRCELSRDSSWSLKADRTSGNVVHCHMISTLVRRLTVAESL